MIFKSVLNLNLNYRCYGPNYWSQTASLQPICMAHQMLSVPPVLIRSSLIFGRMRIGHIEFECCGKFQSPKQRKYFLRVAKIRSLLYNVTLLCTCSFRFFFSLFFLFYFFFKNTLAVLVDYTYFVTFERRIVTYKLQFHFKKTYYDFQDRLGINKTNIQSCPQ